MSKHRSSFKKRSWYRAFKLGRYATLSLLLVGVSACEPESEGEAQESASPKARELRDPSLRNARDSVLGRDPMPVLARSAKSSAFEFRAALPPLLGSVTYPQARRDDDQFADSLDLRDDLALVGAWGTGIRNKGAAHLYRLGEGSALLQSFAPGTLRPDEYFGFAVALGSDFLAVSALRDEQGGEPKGAVYIYERSDAGSYELAAEILPDDPERFKEFGFSLVTAGDHLLIGAPGDGARGGGAGAVYVFGRNGQGDWVQEQKLLALDAQAGDLFGASLDATQDRVVIGARGRSLNEVSVSGVAYVFARGANGWSQETRLEAPVPTPGGRFGFSVAIDQSTLLIGASTFEVGGEPQGRVFAYERDPVQGWSFSETIAPDASQVQTKRFGAQVDLAGSVALISAYDVQDVRDLPGQVLAYAQGEQGWEANLELRPANTPVAYGFGRNLALSGSRVIVGAQLQAENNSSAEAGALHSFELGPSAPVPLLPLWMMVGLGAALVVARRR